MRHGIHKGLMLLLLPVAVAGAEELSGAEMRSLDGQVQEIKSDVLNIAAELNNLEERLLFPSNTQVSLFVALEPEEDFRLDAVQVQINGDPVAHHIYSFKELEALQNGGVQRLYTGNVTTGNHLLNVSYSGKLKNGREVAGSSEFVFAKDVEPKILGLTVAGNGSTDPGISLGDW